MRIALLELALGDILFLVVLDVTFVVTSFHSFVDPLARQAVIGETFIAIDWLMGELIALARGRGRGTGRVRRTGFRRSAVSITSAVIAIEVVILLALFLSIRTFLSAGIVRILLFDMTTIFFASIFEVLARVTSFIAHWLIFSIFFVNFTCGVTLGAFEVVFLASLFCFASMPLTSISDIVAGVIAKFGLLNAVTIFSFERVL